MPASSCFGDRRLLKMRPQLAEADRRGSRGRPLADLDERRPAPQRSRSAACPSLVLELTDVDVDVGRQPVAAADASR